MDTFSLLLLVVVVIPWLIVGGRNRKRDRALQETRWSDLTQRIYQLESAVQELCRAATPSPPSQSAVEQTIQTVEAILSPSTVKTTAAKTIVEPSLGTSPDSNTRVEAPILEPGEPIVIRREEAADQQPLIALTGTEVPPPTFSTEASLTWFEKLKGGLDIEEALDANWLNKIGIVILVLGVAFFLAYQLRQVGPAGKVLVGVLVSLTLLGGGIFLERKAGYRFLGRAGIGGGWALCFFTAYAMYHVEATRVFQSQTPDLVLMLVVATAMVVHPLRYRSQVATGLAFLLAFSTLTISQVSAYSLTAGAILALGLVVIVGRMQWFELEIFGIIAAYGNHWWWLRRIIVSSRKKAPGEPTNDSGLCGLST